MLYGYGIFPGHGSSASCPCSLLVGVATVNHGGAYSVNGKTRTKWGTIPGPLTGFSSVASVEEGNWDCSVGEFAILEANEHASTPMSIRQPRYDHG